MTDIDVAAEPAPEPIVPEVIAPEPEPTPQSKPVMVPVAVVADLREKKRTVESERDELKRQLSDAQALAERLQRSDKQEPPAPQRSVQTPPDDVQRAAAELVINRDIATVNDHGLKAFGAQWNETCSALNAFGVNTPDFLVDVMEIDRTNAHQIMHDIAQDGEKAIQLASMSKAARIAAITRMTMAERAPDGKFASPVPKETKQVSKAPAPPPLVTPSASKEVDWRSDAADDSTFNRGFDEMMERRHKLHNRK